MTEHIAELASVKYLHGKDSFLKAIQEYVDFTILQLQDLQVLVNNWRDEGLGDDVTIEDAVALGIMTLPSQGK